ncbi:MAG: hypothetical protein KC649_03350, partial [Candidatus Omnitrophica bacterium]|nr:hypothetical protein [Candidatus Omnitrophota bacterium]
VSMRSLVWFPLMLFLAEKFISKHKIQHLIALTVIVNFSWLGGFPQTTAYAVLFTVLYCIARLVNRDLRLEKKISLIVWVLCSAVFSVVLALPQFWATLEMGLNSTRIDQDKEFILWGSVSPPALVLPYMPFLNQLFKVQSYFGIPLLLSFICKPELRKNKAMILLAFAAFLMAMGRFNPFYYLLINLPAASLLRNPSKFIFFFSYFLSLAGSISFDALKELIRNDFSFKRIALRVIRFSAVAYCGFFSLYILIQFGSSFMFRWGRWYIDHYIAGKSFHRGNSEIYQDKLTVFIDSLGSLISLNNPYVWMPIILTVVFLAVLWGAGRSGFKKYFPVCIVLVSAADLLIFGFSYQATGFLGNIRSFSQIRSGLEGRESEYKWLDLGSQDKHLFRPSLNMIDGYASLGGYTPIVSKRYYDLFKSLGAVDDGFGYNVSEPKESETMKGLLSFADVGYIASPIPLRNYRPTASDGGMYLYENDSVKDPFAAPDLTVSGKTSEEIKEIISGSSYSPDTAYLESADSFSLKMPEKFEILNYSGNIRNPWVEYYSDSSYFITWNNTYNEGWFYKIDNGEWAPVQRVNYAYQAVPVTPGRHKISLRYKPFYWRYGLPVSCLGWVVVLGGVGLAYRKK